MLLKTRYADFKRLINSYIKVYRRLYSDSGHLRKSTTEYKINKKRRFHTYEIRKNRFASFKK